MAGNDEFIYTLRNANPIEDVVRSYVSIKRQGRNYVCSCPFHSEKSPSCTIFIDSQSFYCFGCGAGGDVITFVMKMENLEFLEAVKLLAQRSGLEVPDYRSKDESYAERKTKIYEINRLAANFFYLNLVKGRNPAGREYFSKRGLSPQTVKKYGLGYAPDSWNELTNFLHSKGCSDEEIIDAWLAGRSQNGNIFDMFRNRVMFPIVDLRGNVIGFGGRVLDDSKPKYLNTGKTPVFDKGSNLFSMNFAKNSDSKKIILCEGYMDVIAVNQAGFSNVVATLGTAITQEQARLISHYAEEAVISYDSDNAGQRATQKAINHLSDVGVRTKILRMNGAKDPDEYIKKFGADRFRRLIDGSDDAIVFMLDRCEQGTDISTEAGRVEYLKRAAEVLAGIESPLEREVYISTAAAKCSISPDVLKAHVDGILKKNQNTQKKAEWRNITNQTAVPKDEINPESVQLRKESKAEEGIILYLLKHTEEADNILSRLPPENFVTSFNKKVYSALLEKIKSCEKFSLSLLTSEFSADEMGRITGIEAKNRSLSMNRSFFDDCVKTLEDYNKFHRRDGSISDEDLRSLFNSKKH